MSDRIVIDHGGSAVATDELFTSAAQLERLAGELRGCTTRLEAVPPGGTAPVPSAEQLLQEAEALLARATERADLARTALTASAHAYAAAEHTVGGLLESLAARFGQVVGAALPFVAGLALPALLGLGVAAGAYALAPPDVRSRVQQRLLGWAGQHKRLLNNPLTVALVRQLVMSADDFGAGLLHFPAGVLGDEGLRVFGLATSSAAVVGVGRLFGELAETPVVARRVGDQPPAAPPDGFAERVSRIPGGETTVRIDRYSVPDGPDRFEVYIAGTKDFSLASADQPWDMTSNVTALAGEDSGSIRAVEQAMADAGVDAGSPVVITGHSQGGLVAARIAASGDYDVQGLLTVGAPAGQVDIPTSIPYVALQHADDIVPALGGDWHDSRPIVVSRELYDDGFVDDGTFFPAHMLPAYLETARLADSAGDEVLGAAAARLNGVDGGAIPVASTLYSGERIGPG